MSTPAALLKFEDLYNEAMEMIKALNVKVQKNVDNREVYRVSSALISIINTVFIEKGKERFLPMFTTTPYQIVVSFIDTFYKEETKAIIVTFIDVPAMLPKSYNEALALSFDERIRIYSYCKENKISIATISAIYGITYNCAANIFATASYLKNNKRRDINVGYMAPYKSWSSMAKAVNLVKQLNEYEIPVFPSLGVKALECAGSRVNTVMLSPSILHKRRSTHPTVKTPKLLIKYCTLLKDCICNSVSFWKKETDFYSNGKHLRWASATNDTAIGFSSSNIMTSRAISKISGNPIKKIGHPPYQSSNCTAYSIEAFRSAITFLDNTINTLNQEGDQGK